MERAALDHLEQQISEEANNRFPSVVQRVEVLQYGDAPVIEPGELLVRVILQAEEGREAQEQALPSGSRWRSCSESSCWWDS